MAFDVALCVLVAGLALRLLTTRDLFEAVILFVSFGLALALVWVRIGAVDVALAEVALGAGVTGALLVNARRRLEQKAPEWLEAAHYRPAAAVLPALCGAFAGVAGLVALTAPRAVQPLAPRILERVPDAAATNPVTAVLLDFRAYDTLLEIGVLVAGITAVWALERGRPAVPPAATAEDEPVLAELVRWIVPLTVMTAIYLTWLGAYEPGGAFQAGALLAGAGVLMLASGFLRPYAPHSPVLRTVVAAGLFVFAAAALATVFAEGALLRYPAAGGYVWVLAIEAVLTVSIAAILAEFFVDVPSAPQQASGEQR
ncbi:MAG TPA: hydrogen gas-evolving membrane-bound hydrogenase subunit E [Longimicrobiales bacterium]|nr:hydrogen gas-evolving membrane-bound hydrogenase subunit E [Longimicrobiales bacterium]